MLIVAGDQILTDPAAGTVLRDAAVLVDGNRIAATGPAGHAACRRIRGRRWSAAGAGSSCPA